MTRMEQSKQKQAKDEQQLSAALQLPAQIPSALNLGRSLPASAVLHSRLPDRQALGGGEGAIGGVSIDTRHKLPPDDYNHRNIFRSFLTNIHPEMPDTGYQSFPCSSVDVDDLVGPSPTPDGGTTRAAPPAIEPSGLIMLD